MSLLRPLACALLFPAVLHAQRLAPARFASHVVPSAPRAADAAPALERYTHALERQYAEPVPGQYFAGLAGGVVGLVGGTLLGVMAAAGDDGPRDPDAVILIPAAVGWLGGTTYALHRFSVAKDAPGKPMAALGGSALGLLGGPVAVLTVPLGARWAYNRSREGPSALR